MRCLVCLLLAVCCVLVVGARLLFVVAFGCGPLCGVCRLLRVALCCLVDALCCCLLFVAFSVLFVVPWWSSFVVCCVLLLNYVPCLSCVARGLLSYVCSCRLAAINRSVLICV